MGRLKRDLVLLSGNMLEAHHLLEVNWFSTFRFLSNTYIGLE